jgi:hypothetical protein
MRSPLTLLPPPVRGCIAIVALALNTVLWTLPLFAFALVKLLLPLAAVRRLVDPVLHGLAGGWVAGNSLWMGLLHPTRWLDALWAAKDARMDALLGPAAANDDGRQPALDPVEREG